ncbi:MAG: PAS domain S-box protein [Halanaeroarchaeum sp.]
MDARVLDQTDDSAASPFQLLRAVATAFDGNGDFVDVWTQTVHAASQTGFTAAAIVGSTGVIASTADDLIDESLADAVAEATTVEIFERTDGSPVLSIPVEVPEDGSRTLVLEHDELPTDGGELDEIEREQYRDIGEYLATRVRSSNSSRRIREEVSTQRRTFRKMHSVATQMVGAQSEEGVYHLAIDAAENILDFDICTIDLVEDDEFVPVATSSGLSDESARRVSADYGIGGKTYQSGKSIVVDDLRESDAARPVDESFRSMLSVPIDDIGVFQAATEEVGLFDETDADLAELLMSYVSQTLSRIRSEAALREEEAKYRTLIEQSHDGVLTISDGSISFINDRGADILGAGRERIRETDVWTFVHEDDRDRLREVWNDLVHHETDSVTFDARITPVEGETRFCEISARRIDWGDDPALLATVRDVTERKAYERELERQNERLDEFASVLSHDLRNPPHGGSRSRRTGRRDR